MITACFLSFFTNLLVGPSEIFNMPNSVVIMAIGQLVRGLVDPFLLIPSLPEMIESVVPHFPEDAEAEINNISSGMFNMFLGIG